MKSRHISRRPLTRGGTLIETAMVLPVITLLFLGIIEYARYYYIESVLANAAREGARYGILNPTDVSGITTRARRFTVGLGGQNVGVSVATPSGTATGQPITVTVTYQTRLFIPIPFGRTLNLVNRATMRIE